MLLSGGFSHSRLRTPQAWGAGYAATSKTYHVKNMCRRGSGTTRIVRETSYGDRRTTSHRDERTYGGSYLHQDEGVRPNSR